METINKKPVSTMTNFSAYLIMVGIRSTEYNYADDILFNNLEYFKKCYKAKLSTYKALMFLNDYIKGEYKF